MTTPSEPITDSIRHERESKGKSSRGATGTVFTLIIVGSLLTLLAIIWFGTYQSRDPSRATLNCDKGANILTLETASDTSKPKNTEVTRKVGYGQCTRLSQAALEAILNTLGGSPPASAPTTLQLTTCPPSSTTTTTKAGAATQQICVEVAKSP